MGLRALQLMGLERLALERKLGRKSTDIRARQRGRAHLKRTDGALQRTVGRRLRGEKPTQRRAGPDRRSGPQRSAQTRTQTAPPKASCRPHRPHPRHLRRLPSRRPHRRSRPQRRRLRRSRACAPSRRVRDRAPARPRCMPLPGRAAVTAVPPRCSDSRRLARAAAAGPPSRSCSCAPFRPASPRSSSVSRRRRRRPPPRPRRGRRPASRAAPASRRGRVK